MSLLIPHYQFIFPLKVPNISELDSFLSPEITFQNIPWKMQICKQTFGAKQWLSVYLHCEKKGAPADWSCSAQFSAKLLSFNRNVRPIENKIDPNVFNMNGFGYGFPQWVEWHNLFDPVNSYVKDDSIQLEIKIKAVDSLNENRTKLTFEAQDKCCEDSLLEMYSLTVANIDQLMAVRSPEFKIKDLPFDLTVFKSYSGHLHTRVESKSEISNVEICKMRVTINLLSFKEDVNTIEKFKSQKLCGGYDLSDKIVSWEALFDPKNGFVDENAIKIQVKIEMDKKGEVAPAPKRRRICNHGANMLEMECAICHNDIIEQNVSSTACGHVFCTECIATAMENSNTCPSCNQPISEDKVHRLFLPIRN